MRSLDSNPQTKTKYCKETLSAYWCVMVMETLVIWVREPLPGPPVLLYPNAVPVTTALKPFNSPFCTIVSPLGNVVWISARSKNEPAILEVNDTIFTTSATNGVSSTAGTIFITDTSANKIYVLTKPYFSSNEVYTAANVANVVGLVDLNTGIVTTIATGFKGVHGLAFSPIRVAIAPSARHEHNDEGEGNDDH